MVSRIITYKDLQIELEQYYLNKVQPIIDELKFKYEFLDVFKLRKDKLFYSLINHALCLDDHYAVTYLIERVKRKLDINVNIRFYLYQSTMFNITCLPNVDSLKDELYIFVSQHFFNNLDEDEQVGIIGHEVGHYILNHMSIPIREILEYPFDLDEINGLKSDLLNWSKSCELTADMVGLVANDFNFKAYSTAIIKHHTGLSDSSISKFNISPLVNLVLEEYNKLADDPLYNGETSTHPLTPLRVKVINSITSTKLIRNFGDNLDPKSIIEYKKEFNDLVEELINGIYPEMMPNNTYANDILAPLMLAVALADGVLDKKEIKAIERMIPGHPSLKNYEKFILQSNLSEIFESTVNKLIKEGVSKANKLKFNKHEIVPVIRSLLLVAASDENIERNELEVIYEFAKEFDFSRQDIILILQTHDTI